MCIPAARRWTQPATSGRSEHQLAVSSNALEQRAALFSYRGHWRRSFTCDPLHDLIIGLPERIEENEQRMNVLLHVITIRVTLDSLSRRPVNIIGNYPHDVWHALRCLWS